MAKVVILMFVVLAVACVYGQNNGGVQGVGLNGGDNNGVPQLIKLFSITPQDNNGHSVGSSVSSSSVSKLVDGKLVKETNTQGAIYEDGKIVKQFQNSN